MSHMTNSAPAGWYPDPSNPSLEHWWNGSAYTGSRPAPALAPPPAPSQFSQPGQVYGTPAVGYAPVYGGPVSLKSRTVAAILGFFLGGLGVDRFYLGNVGMGIAKLFLGWLTLGIWPLVDWIVILAGGAHDGEGLPVRNWS